MAAPSNQTKEACYQKWMALQQQELSELTNAINSRSTHAELSQLIDKIMTHFKDYADKRALLARTNVWSFFVPSSLASSLELLNKSIAAVSTGRGAAGSCSRMEELLRNWIGASGGEEGMEAEVDESGRALRVTRGAGGGRSVAAGDVEGGDEDIDAAQAVEYLAVIKRYDQAMHTGMGRKRDLDHDRN